MYFEVHILCPESKVKIVMKYVLYGTLQSNVNVRHQASTGTLESKIYWYFMIRESKDIRVLHCSRIKNILVLHTRIKDLAVLHSRIKDIPAFHL